ncbi:hypothetical protein ACFL5V_05035 [Fibrobacterota bacterium]
MGKVSTTVKTSLAACLGLLILFFAGYQGNFASTKPSTDKLFSDVLGNWKNMLVFSRGKPRPNQAGGIVNGADHGIGEADSRPETGIESENMTSRKAAPEGFQTLTLPSLGSLSISVPEGRIKEYTIYSMLGTRIASSREPLMRPRTSDSNRGIFFISVFYGNGQKFIQKIVNLQ